MRRTAGGVAGRLRLRPDRRGGAEARLPGLRRPLRLGSRRRRRDARVAAKAMTPTLRELILTSLKIGCLGFGGPAGQISLMHRIFVDEKKWIDDPRFLHALSFCPLLPGPEAQQLATYVGWLLRGTLGGLIAGTLFVLPGAAVVFALAWLYAAHGDVAPVAAAFGGVKAAVMALVFEALLRVGRRAIKGRAEAVIAVAAFLALALFALPFPLVVLVAALVGAARGAPDAASDALPPPTGAGPGK